MGHFLSYIHGAGLWPCSSCSGLPLWADQDNCSPAVAAALTPTTDDSASASLLLHLPADVLLLISDHLDAPAALSLSLACRSMHAVFFTSRSRNRRRGRKLEPEDKRRLLQLLERDPFGRGLYYCHSCNMLHPFCQSWSPRPGKDDSSAAATGGHGRCAGDGDRFSPTGNPYGLSFAHARLAMNRHLYGPEHGIPLRNLEVRHVEPHGPVEIRCSTVAAIVDNELLIRRSYAFVIDAARIADFRRRTGPRDFRLCEHVSFFSNASAYRQHIPELQRRTPVASSAAVAAAARRGVGRYDAFAPCRSAPGSCGLCLMDYDISIASTDPDRWAIEITAHHQLGACRSPEDWRWARFTEAGRPHLFFPNQPNRRSSTCYPGTVKKLWVEQNRTSSAETEDCSYQ